MGDQRKDETGSKLKVKTKVKTSKPEEQSEDNDNPSLIVADQIQSSPVTSNGTTIEEMTNQNKIAALQETIESQERDEEYQEKVVTKLKIKKNQREALQTTMQQIKHEPEGACLICCIVV